jgi:hypothetical protein
MQGMAGYMIFFYSKRMTSEFIAQSSANAPNPNVQPSIAIALQMGRLVDHLVPVTVAKTLLADREIVN